MTFPEITDRTFGSAPFAVTVTGGPAAGQVALVSLTPSVCTLAGATSTRVGGLARTTATVKILAAGPVASPRLRLVTPTGGRRPRCGCSR